jgi:nucleotide-binding universal stress UspA family protein
MGLHEARMNFYHEKDEEDVVMTNESPSKLERILIATDGSQQAQWATQFGQQLAQQLGAKVLLVHVVMPSVPTFSDFDTARRMEQVRKEFGTELLARTRRSFPAYVEVSTAQRAGFPSEEIAAEAKAWRADLVVIGTHGQGHLASLVLGSTADAVIRQSPCPVITISQEPKSESAQRMAQAEAQAQAGLGAAAESAYPAMAHVQHASADE